MHSEWELTKYFTFQLLYICSSSDEGANSITSNIAPAGYNKVTINRPGLLI